MANVGIVVEDLKVAMKNVAKSGGKVDGEPMEIPGIGTFISFFDTEGNRVGMIQPTEMGK